MTKHYIIIVLFVCQGCMIGSRKEDVSNSLKESYTANRDFGGISNQIAMSELDSLIQKIPLNILISNTKHNDNVNHAISILSDHFAKEKLNPKHFYILDIEELEDSIIVFHLNHLDYYIYKYNWQKKNEELKNDPADDGFVLEIPPITGNVSGFEGWYNVNMNSGKIEIVYAQ